MNSVNAPTFYPGRRDSDAAIVCAPAMRVIGHSIQMVATADVVREQLNASLATTGWRINCTTQSTSHDSDSILRNAEDVCASAAMRPRRWTRAAVVAREGRPVAFDAFVDHSRKTIDTILNRAHRRVDDALGFADQGLASQIYNEATFRHFLSREQKRAVRAGRSLFLMLVSVRANDGSDARISRAVAGRLFSALSGCVREVDFIGWYRDRQVAGAVLAQGHVAPRSDAERVIVERVTRALRQQLSTRISQGLHVRLLDVSGRE